MKVLYSNLDDKTKSNYNKNAIIEYNSFFYEIKIARDVIVQVLRCKKKNFNSIIGMNTQLIFTSSLDYVEKRYKDPKDLIVELHESLVL